MKNFEKWLNKNKPKQDEKWEMVNYSWAAEQGWKAALEWLKSVGYCDGMGYYCSFGDDIEEELTGIKQNRPKEV